MRTTRNKRGWLDQKPRIGLRRSRFKAKKKDPATVKAWRAVKEALWVRAQGMCEVPWCHRQANDAHHVKKRSQGGENRLDNLLALDRRCHDATDLPTEKGRLVIHPAKASTGYGFAISQNGTFALLGPFTDEDTP